MGEDFSALVSKVAQIAERSAALDSKFHTHIEDQKEARMLKQQRDDRVEAKVDAIHARIDELTSVKVVAENAQKDIDEHKADHKWWFGALFTAWGALIALFSFLANNLHRFLEWAHNFGKVPPSHP